MKRLIVGITGASGVIYGIRILEILRELPEVQTHLILSNAGKRTILLETDYSIAEVEELADEVSSFGDIAANICSGSFKTHGMIVAPCSIRTLSGIAHSTSENLILRAADVALKDRRRLLLLVRETPLHRGHIDLMSQAAKVGAIIMPPVPAFYHRPKNLDDIINQTVNRALDLMDIELGEDLFKRWQGPDSGSGQPENTK